MKKKTEVKKDPFEWDKVIKGFERPTISAIVALLIYYFSFEPEFAEGLAVAGVTALGLGAERLYSHLKWKAKQKK